MININTELINCYLKKQKLTKTDFCKVCGISLYTLNKILKNNKIRSVVPFIKIAKLMKVMLKDLLDF